MEVARLGRIAYQDWLRYHQLPGPPSGAPRSAGLIPPRTFRLTPTSLGEAHTEPQI